MKHSDRRYNLISTYKERKTICNATPMTHKEACAFKSKFTPHAEITLSLEEIK